jgi:hypothetical protein
MYRQYTVKIRGYVVGIRNCGGDGLQVLLQAQQWERALEAFRGSQLPIDRP